MQRISYNKSKLAPGNQNVGSEKAKRALDLLGWSIETRFCFTPIMLIRTAIESFGPDTDDASLIYEIQNHRRLVLEMIGLVGHVAITVRDLQETIEFYTKLGFQLTSRNETPTQIVVFLVAGKARLEVFAPKKTKSPIELGPEDLGIKHIALEVDDIQKSYEEAKAKGVVFTETRMRTDGSVGTVFFKDPSGITLQFIQRASG